MMQNNEIERPLREEIAEIKQTLKAMQADIEIIKRYNGGVYDYDIAEEPPYIPTHACSLEDQLAATKRYQEYCQRHPEFITTNGLKTVAQGYKEECEYLKEINNV